MIAALAALVTGLFADSGSILAALTSASRLNPAMHPDHPVTIVKNFTDTAEHAIRELEDGRGLVVLTVVHPDGKTIYQIDAPAETGDAVEVGVIVEIMTVAMREQLEASS